MLLIGLNPDRKTIIVGKVNYLELVGNVNYSFCLLLRNVQWTSEIRTSPEFGRSTCVQFLDSPDFERKPKSGSPGIRKLDTNRETRLLQCQSRPFHIKIINKTVQTSIRFSDTFFVQILAFYRFQTSGFRHLTVLITSEKTENY